MTTISLEDAQAQLAETVRRTEAGPVVLADSGQPVAVVLSVEEYRRLSVVEARERERLSQEAYDQIFGPFDRGEFHELTDLEWQALMASVSPRTTPGALPCHPRARTCEATSNLQPGSRR